MDKFRKKYSEIVKHLKRKEFSIITGARQTGKTTLLKQLYSELKQRNEEVWFLSFESSDILEQINISPENLFKFVQRPDNPLYSKASDVSFILIDEIQYAKDPTNFLKYLYDTYAPNLKIIATGSSAFYIDSKFKDSLVGRKKIFTLSTLDFEEFLIFKEREELVQELELLRSDRKYLSLKYQEIEQLFDEYLIFGGYPAVVLIDDLAEKKEMLAEIKDSYIQKDIFESKVENKDIFYKLMIVLASQTGSLLNKNELSKSLRMHLSTVERYIFVMQKSFHISLIKPFYGNLKKEITKMPKVYFNDTGLRNILISNFIDVEYRSDKGELLENYVYTRLNEKFKEYEVKFWRTADQKEVDFVISSSVTGMEAFEVKFSSLNIKLSKYKKFQELYPDIGLKFITYNDSSEPKIIQAIRL